MHMVIICPTCDCAFDVTCSVTINSRVRLGNRKLESKKIQSVRVIDVKPLTPKECAVLKKVKPYLKPDMNKASLVETLIKKVGVKKSDVSHMVNLIKKAYGINIDTAAGDR